MKKWTQEERNGYILIHNEGGPDLGYSKDSGISILEVDGYAFKDLNRNGVLDPYEDWRLPMEERIRDLASRMELEDIAGLMLYSAHQSIARPVNDFSRRFAGTYNGKKIEECDADLWDLTDQQKAFLDQDRLRHVLITVVESAETAAKWNNQAQTFAEGRGLGIPVNTSSDPRHEAQADTEFNSGAGGAISRWPSSLGMAATFDPSLMERFGQIASREYRALGITTALSPQIDLATEPRWMRYDGTFGEGTELTIDMARAYCDGFQTSDNGSWGMQSVNAMVKHWPGGGSGEGGRDAHFAYGKYAVYPGNNFEEHKRPFLEGAFQLHGETGMASAVMPYYTISTGQDTRYGENVGNSYSKYIISDLLRDTYQYDGVVCTDWGITHDNKAVTEFGKTCWGVEHLTVAERHYKALMAGVDQFGGNNEAGPILEAYAMGVKEHGETWMRQRMEQSAKRLLRNIFRVGLFENPYLDPEVSKELVGCPKFMQEGFDAQLRSCVLLKNHEGVLPLHRQKVYIPKRHVPEMKNWFGAKMPAYDVEPVPRKILEKYFDPVETPEEADVALVFMTTPSSTGYDEEKGYIPVTLQYRPYTALKAREVSLAGGHPTEAFTNRSYKGKTNTAYNECELDTLIETKKAMGNKPVIVSIYLRNPMVMAELEPYADAILVDFKAQTEAILRLITGQAEPSGLMPCQLPEDMDAVEEQMEDVPRDMRVYQDQDGNRYDFGFGMNWSGPIQDERTAKYR